MVSLSGALASLVLFSAQAVVVLSTIVVGFLAFRYLRIKLGGRIAADGRKAVLVTGGTSGIGLSVAKHLHRLGFSVFVGYRNTQTAGYRELVELSKTLHSGAANEAHLMLVQMDISCEQSIDSADKQITSLLSEHNLELYGLINNAALSLTSPFQWCRKESIIDTIDTNMRGSALVTRRFITRIMRARGKVVNVSSPMGYLPVTGTSLYGLTKSGLNHFSTALREDLSDYQATCVNVLPGYLVSATNIVYHQYKSLLSTLEDMSESDREFYKKPVEEFVGVVEKMLFNRLRQAGEDPQQVEASYGFKLPQTDGRNSAHQPESISLVMRMVHKMMGREDGKTLEESAVMDAFEDAIMLKHPPARLFAGNPVFAHLTGPFVEILPLLMLELLARSGADLFLER